MSLKEKLLKNSTKKVQTLDKSTVFQSQDSIPTMVPVLNIALSGSISGGLKSGITGIAGKSRHFKTGLDQAAAEKAKRPSTRNTPRISESGKPLCLGTALSAEHRL